MKANGQVNWEAPCDIYFAAAVCQVQGIFEPLKPLIEKRIVKKVVLLVIALLSLPGWSRGAVLFSDSFSYATGSLTTNSGFTWITHSGATGTTGQTQVATGKVQLLFNQGEDVSASLAGQPYLSGGTTNTFYAGFTVRFAVLPPGGGEYFAHFKDAGATSGFRGRVWALTNGAAAQKFRLAISSTSGTVISATNLTDLSLNTDYRVVVRLINTSSVATLWINPAAETDPSVSSTEAASAVTVAMFALRQPASGTAALTLDDLVVGTSFFDVITNAALAAPVITLQPQSQSVTAGATVLFTAAASGNPLPAYQWQWHGTNLPGQTSSSLTLNVVTHNQAGPYRVFAANSAGTTNSNVALLTVTPATTGFSLVTYNVAGNGASDWSTNAPQVQAIARQLQYLNPDFITFQEIPFDLRYELTNFVTAFFPGYALAVTNGGDSFITSAFLSRYPITRFSKWLDGIDLRSFGYSNVDNSLDNFTRDLSEIQVNVPGFPQPLHLLTTHLKSTANTTYADAAAKRAAEAAAITNFIATNLHVVHPLHPYVLTGDMNDSSTNALAIQTLISPPTGLRLTNPTNPLTGSVNTFSIRASVSSRLDYILPSALLSTNVAAAQVFRTDLLPAPPPPLLGTDSETASDHLPVLMVFNNPYAKPFKLLSVGRSNQTVTLKWESVPGQPYCVESSTNLTTWTILATNLVATNSSFSFTTNIPDAVRYFRIFRGS